MNRINAQSNTKQERGMFSLTEFAILPGSYYARAELIDKPNNNFDNWQNNGELKVGLGNSFRLQNVTGYFVKERISLGVGIAGEWYSDINYFILPVFADARFYSRNSWASGFVYFNLGPSAGFNGTQQKVLIGIMWEAGIGTKLYLPNITDKCAFTFSFGLHDQYLFNDRVEGYKLNGNSIIRTPSIKIGMLF